MLKIDKQNLKDKDTLFPPVTFLFILGKTESLHTISAHICIHYYIHICTSANGSYSNNQVLP